ncbi:MAG: AAA family ATPase [Bacteroidales bacterium]|nr:AAA family ATPase [Bacteroidales bacterium]
MTILNHIIEGFGGFSNRTTFEFPKENSTLILGVNGAGKTSLLNSIYTTISYCISSIIGVNHREIGVSQSTISIGKELSEVISEILLKQDESPLEIGYKILQNGQINLIGKEQNVIRKHFIQLHKDYDYGILPLFRYFQSEKNIDNDKGIVSSQKFNKLENRNIGYAENYSRGILIKEVTSFLINQVNIENQAKVDKNNLNYETKIGVFLRTTLNNFTSLLYGQGVEVKVMPSKFSSGQSIVIVKNGLELEFSQLSSGERYIFTLVLELVYRTVALNPRMNDFKSVPGIVLIDEVENHLHPRWQLTIVKALETCFPMIQFIVSSHSPLIASSVRNNQIIALSNFEKIPIYDMPDVYSGTSDELLEKILHSDIQINVFQNEREEIDSLINTFKFDLAEKKLVILKELIKSNPQWIKDFENKISFGKA